MSAPLTKVVETSACLAATRSRKIKVAAIAALLQELDPHDVAIAVGYLTGDPRQGRIGVGWATLREADVAPAREATLTIAYLDHVISQVAATSGAGSVAARLAVLRDALFARATQAEAEFIRRLFFGEMRQGALDGVMTDAIAAAYAVPHDSVRRASMLLGDLRETARIAATGGEVELRRVSLLVLRPISPMLATTAASVVDAIGAGETVSVEYKLDGARIQLHRAGDEVRIFTRNLNDVTARLHEIAAIARTFRSERFILDGEVLGFFDDDAPQAFQDTISNFATDGRDGAGLAPFFFDCLHVDGTDLIDRPLAERQLALDRVVGNRAVPRVVTSDSDVASAFTERSLATGHEGVMIKSIGSLYEAGRRGQSWRKVKPVHTLDLVVIGVEWGHGRRRGWLSNLHLGARDDDHEDRFVMVGKTFKGLTDDVLRWQTTELLARETERRGIAVLVRPELVVEIALDGVQQSSRYPGGVALRFARVRRYRPDKPATQSDTLSAVRRLLPRRA